jgi:hypothetical protein
MFTAKASGKSKSVSLKIVGTMLALMFFVVLGPGLLNIDISQASGRGWDDERDDDYDNDWGGSNFCSRTAMAAFRAGKNEIKDDYWIAVGNCNNLSEADDRAECLEDAKAEYKEGKELTREQREARLEICENLGEAPYDPQLDPKDFVDPTSITETTANPYFPLVPGTKWVYMAYDEEDNLLERITVIVRKEIKTIEYPEESGKFFKCVVVNDVVEEYDPDENEYTVIENTDDWYIQHGGSKDVLYMGEIARDFELDLDGKPELVELEGSWKAGKDFAKPGILMWGNPDPANENHYLYRQEFALGNAEDMGGVISRGTESVTVPKGTYSANVVQTKDWTPIEPEVYELKYYAPGIGMIKEENPESGEYVELVEKTTVP